MTVAGHHQLARRTLVGVRTDETLQLVQEQTACVPTRSDWPRDEFLAWLDETKARLGIRSDYQLAQHFDIGHTLISGWRNGRQRPSIPTLSQIASVLGEDARKLWVLAGTVDAADVGLAEAAPPVVRRALPEELQNLIATYFDERLDERDREAIRRHVRILDQTVRSELAARPEAKQPRSRAS